MKIETITLKTSNAKILLDLLVNNLKSNHLTSKQTMAINELKNKTV